MKPRFIRALSLFVLSAFLLSVPVASAHVVAVKSKPNVQAKKAIVKDPKAQALIEKTLRQYPPRILILQWGVSTTSQPATSDIEKTDWSGSVSVSEGALKVRRLIRFEKHDHDRVYVRSGQKVEWTSTIYNMRDGLIIAVGASDNATLTISTPYTGQLTFKVGDLAKQPYSNKELKIEGRDVNYSLDAVLTVAPKAKKKGKSAQPK